MSRVETLVVTIHRPLSTILARDLLQRQISTNYLSHLRSSVARISNVPSTKPVDHGNAK